MIELTQENYYESETDDRMSVSQLESFRECEFSAYKRFVEQDKKEIKSDAMTIGSFMHALSEGEYALKAFKDIHPEIFYVKNCKTGMAGDYKMPYQEAIDAFHRAKKDPFFAKAIQGQKEEIFTAKWCGVDWKIKVDIINHEEKFCSDLKYVKSIREEQWKKFYVDLEGNVIPPPRDKSDIGAFAKNMKVSFYEAYDYWTRVAVYWKILHEATGVSYNMLMPAISKEMPADFEVLQFKNMERFQYELNLVETDIKYVQQIKNGTLEPLKCGECSACRETKTITYLEEAISLI